MRSRVLTTAVAAAVVWLCLPAPAWAIDIRVPCETPSVFGDAAVNVVVLPYSQPASLGRTQAGEQLGALVQLETLLAIAKYGRIGITQLVGDVQQGCTPDVVLDKLLGRQDGALERLKPGGALILMWGRIFESGADLYLQSYIRFLRGGLDESIDVSVRDRQLSGALSTQSFACTPRKMGRRDLDDIQRQFSSARLLHERPDASSPVIGMPEGEGPFSYWITDVRGDWVRLQPMDNRSGAPRRLTPGWLLARAAEAQWSLRRQMPELLFVEGVAGYLAERVQPAAPGAAGWLGSADAALNRYLEAWGANAVLGTNPATGGTPMAVAVPRQLRGFVAIRRGEGSGQSLAEAQAQFERAATLVPYSGHARNLVTMVRLARAYRQPTIEEPQRLIDEFRTLLGTAPDNSVLLANLVTAYDLALADAALVSGEDRGRLTRERDSIRALLQR